MNRFPGVDYMDFDSLLTEEERLVRDTVRAFVEHIFTYFFKVNVLMTLNAVAQCQRQWRPKDRAPPITSL